MTPSERERRIKAASDALQLKVAAHAMKGIDDWPALVEAALDAADEAVPMVAKIEAERAEAAARASRDLLARIAASLKDGTLDIPGVCHAVEAEIAELLAAYPSFSGEEGTEG